jgi:hypothetical protein
MSPNENFLKDHICPHCHAAILFPHPEEKFEREGYFKCTLCGFAKQLKKELTEVNKIIYGRKKE